MNLTNERNDIYDYDKKQMNKRWHIASEIIYRTNNSLGYLFVHFITRIPVQSNKLPSTFSTFKIFFEICQP